MSVKFQYNKITKYIVTAVCTEPLHIGSAMGEKEAVLVHPVDNLPFIQATSIAGVFRKYCKEVYQEKTADDLFGSENLKENDNASDYGSKVKFGDGIFRKENVKLELRPRVKLDPVSGSSDSMKLKGQEKSSGQKFETEYIGAGAEFSFPVYLYGEEYQNELENIFAGFQNQTLVLGGQKSNGCGYIRIEKLLCKEFDLTKPEDRKLWSSEEELQEKEYENKTSQLKSMGVERRAYEIIVDGETEGELLVKSIAVAGHGSDAPDAMNIQNANKDYIVPGSSFKGAIRNQMEKIAQYLGQEDIIENTFGKKKSENENGKIGNIGFFDTVVGERAVNDMAEIAHRIHIDKFTGGVRHGGLFSQKNVSGKVCFKIIIQDTNEPDRTCGLLLLALRDLAIHTMSVGGGYNIGKGMIAVNKIEILSCKEMKKAVLNFKEKDANTKIKDEHGLVEQCIQSIKGGV